MFIFQIKKLWKKLVRIYSILCFLLSLFNFFFFFILIHDPIPVTAKFETSWTVRPHLEYSYLNLVPYNLIKFNTNYMHFLHRYHHHLTLMYFFHEFHPEKSKVIQWLYRNWYEEMRRLMNLDIKEWITVARNDQNIRISILPNHVIFIFSFHSINSWFFRNVFGLCYRNARNRKIKGFKEFPREFNNSAIARASGTNYNL